MTDKKSIGDRIKQARTLAKLSQEQLAQRLGVRFQSVQQWEKGQTSPRIMLIPRLAVELSTTPGWIQFGNPEILENPESTILTTATMNRILSAHQRSLAQCIAMGWIKINRSDVSSCIVSDIFQSQLIAEFKTRESD